MKSGFSIAPPRYTKAQIIQKADALIRRYEHIVGPNVLRRVGLSFDDIYHRVIQPEYGIGFSEEHDLGHDVLGCYNPVPHDMNVNARMGRSTGDPRRAWTCWHELGHAILHGPWLDACIDAGLQSANIVTTEEGLTAHVENTLEWQANIFAAHASAPRWLIDELIYEAFALLDRPLHFQGPAYYDFYVRDRDRPHQYVASFDEYCKRIATFIRCRFWGLSVESLSYRVRESPIVGDVSRQSGVLNRQPPARTARRVSRTGLLRRTVRQAADAMLVPG